MARLPYCGPLCLLALVYVLSGLSGCTDAELKAAGEYTVGIGELLQNRSVTEQCVRDLKSKLTPSDPDYAQVMADYEKARSAYDRYLDDVESGQKPSRTRSLRGASARDVQNLTADFYSDVTAVLKPSPETRHLHYQRAVVIPEDLSKTMRKLSNRDRDKLVDDMDQQVRWAPWGEL